MSSTAADPRALPPAVCPQCQAGNLHLQRVVYARWYGAQFITIPNFPSWVCDVCGSLEYDRAALEQVRMILGREARSEPEAPRRPASAPAANPHPPRPTGRRPI